MEENSIAEAPLSTDIIKEKIYIIRGKKIMFDKDLAMLYGVPTKRLNEAVKRNIKRFPDDFMFQLNKQEIEMFSRSQIATLKRGSGSNVKYAPLAFTEQGIAMLSSILNSDRAISVNIQIIRVFTKLREMIDNYKELREKVEEMEKNNETNFKEIFRVLRAILSEEEKPKNKIGFSID
ncbi:MAG: ORF6N domain-containing protein [Patescibacteria group bacterium]